MIEFLSANNVNSEFPTQKYINLILVTSSRKVWKKVIIKKHHNGIKNSESKLLKEKTILILQKLSGKETVSHTFLGYKAMSCGNADDHVSFYVVP